MTRHTTSRRESERRESERREIADRLLGALASVHRLSARLHGESARSLSRMRETEAHRKLGFSCFGDFSRETLGLAPGTVKDRLKLHEVLHTSAPTATAFEHGEISESKAIALLPILRTRPTDAVTAQWLLVAQKMSVRRLRCAVRDTLRAMGEGADPEPEEEWNDGRVVAFSGPVPVARMFDEAIAVARKVLGTRAPRYRCVEALLAETSSDWQRLEPDLEERLERRSGGPGQSSRGVGDAPAAQAGLRGDEAQTGPTNCGALATHEGAGLNTIAHPADRPTTVHDIAANPERARSTTAIHEPAAPTGDEAAAHRDKPATPTTVLPKPDPALLLRALRTAEQIDEEIAEIEGLIMADSPAPTSTDPSRDLPNLPAEIDRVIACERLEAPLRIYRADLLRELRDTGAMESLGYRSWNDFAESYLGLSERAARSLVAEGRLFATEAGLRDAYGRGEVSLGKAFLLRRAVGSGRVAACIQRAADVTHIQLAREVRLIEWARQVRAHLTLGLPAEEMEESLMRVLTRWGWTPQRVHDLLLTVGLDREARGDPAVDPGAMNRLERLIDLLILTLWDEPPKMEEEDDRRMSTRANAMMEVRFWAPDPVAKDWKTALGRIRERNGVGCPPWVAVSMLVADALQEWERQDPKRVPTEEKILLRDGYRCMVPVCSSMRNLEAHHIEFLSAGGSDEEWNKVTLCHAHHRMVHEGVIRVWGRAPHALHWEIGCSPGRPPLMRLTGNRIIRRNGRPVV
jgi:hypothetical protein